MYLTIYGPENYYLVYFRPKPNRSWPLNMLALNTLFFFFILVFDCIQPCLSILLRIWLHRAAQDEYNMNLDNLKSLLENVIFIVRINYKSYLYLSVVYYMIYHILLRLTYCYYIVYCSKRNIINFIIKIIPKNIQNT